MIALVGQPSLLGIADAVQHLVLEVVDCPRPVSRASTGTASMICGSCEATIG